ncbi:MAG: PSD1 domain-containing protein [Armatimonadetes bacterium]|nr:PSD1 domain-containing protein [Armatimonadota bacterium]
MTKLAALFRFLPFGLLATGLLAQSPSSPQKPGTDFSHDIEPILRAHCTQCHHAARKSGGLDLSSYEGILKGGNSGPSVKAGKAKESLLLQRILGQGGQRMPLGFAPLTDKDTALVEKWINEGARLGGGETKKHWAYAAPVKPEVPRVGRSDWVKNPIDAFVLARLQKEGLRPSPEADRTTLIRRLSLDLTGLPPTPAEVDAFLGDQAPGAYERVVDRLLASPHFGEKMSLPWLDAARYADSNGFQQDGDNHQYVWRDWVVRAINQDMPFDEFTVEQLAGDLLPSPTQDQLVATGFNRNHMLNGEGGAIPEEQRNVILFDRVDVTSTTWLGLTMACARCHDHKYDPFTQTDYYQLLAYFNNVPESGVPPGGGQYRIAEPWVYAGTPAQTEALDRARRAQAKAEAQLREAENSVATKRALAEWKAKTMIEVHRAYDAKVIVESWNVAPPFKGSSFDEAFDTVYPPEKGDWSGERERADWEDGKINQIIGDNTAVYLRRTVHVATDAKVLLLIGSDDGVKLWVNGKPMLSHKVTRGVVPGDEKLVLTLDKLDNEIVMKIVNGGGIGGFSFSLVPGGIPVELLGELMSESYSSRAKVKQYFLAVAPPRDVADAKARLDAANKELERVKGETPQVMVMSDRAPRKTFIYSRGNYEVPLGEVHPRTPSPLPASPTPQPPNRLGLARWIVSADNPLTSRVEVNRIWQMLFGRGLVRTPENFGVQGEPPTHPELLDWMAVDFRESGWKVKRLVRQIVTSSTYRQSSRVTKKLYERDPDNRLLARGSRFRMPSLVLRDVALASSGLLNAKIGGPPVYPYQPKGIWDGLSITNERDFTYPQSKGADLYRRSLYTFWRRTVAPGNMFDTSSRQACTVRPSLTSTPLHALTTLNDVTWVEAARVLAERAMTAQPHDVNAQIETAFRLVCARTLTDREVRVLRKSYERALSNFQRDPRAAKDFLSSGEERPSVQLDQPALAALASVCLAIYNLDEALTRE